LASFRIAHLSDVHVWERTFNPVRLLNKRVVGMAALMLGRARRFRLERLGALVEKVESIRPDHVLITGDLTTTALPEEFARAAEVLRPLLRSTERATVIPGNHDRYTGNSMRRRHFERAFGRFAGGAEYPWLRIIAGRTAVLALDPSRPALSARGRLPTEQLHAARVLWEEQREAIDRLIVACHYPIEAPEGLRDDLRWKRLMNAEALAEWLETVGPHIYCCGHVHRAWAFTPSRVPDQLCLNAGAPLLVDPEGTNPPGFLEIMIDGPDVVVVHHGWDGSTWVERPMGRWDEFFDPARRRERLPIGE
jgi:3',5'-cyclic AMP phosphodiesterase CpdA